MRTAVQGGLTKSQIVVCTERHVNVENTSILGRANEIVELINDIKMQIWSRSHNEK